MKTSFFFLIALALAVLVFLNSQSLWLVLAAFVMVLAVLRFEPREHFQYAFVVITLALFFALVSSRLPITNKTAQDASPGISASLTAVQGTLKGPEVLTGSGPATFAYDFEAFRPTSFNTTPYWANTFPQGHDFAATLLATGGLIAFLIFLWIVILAIQPFLHVHMLEPDLAMIASVSAFLLAALFLYPASFGELLLLFILLGMIQRVRSVDAVSFDSVGRWRSYAFSLAGMACAAAVLAGIFTLGEKYVAVIFSNNSNSLAASGDLGGAFSKINNAIALDPSDVYYRAASGILVSEAKTLTNSSDPAASTELASAVSNAVQSAENAVSENSHDPANWGNLGSVYEAIMPIITGADISAENSYQQAASLDPANPQWDVDIARVFMESANLLSSNSSTAAVKQLDWMNAESYLDKAITLKDDYADPRVLLVELYLQEGNLAQAIEKVQELKAENPLDPGVAFELGYLYYENGQSDQAQEEFQVATILDPNYSNAYYFPGLINDQQGMEAQALADFLKVESLNPGNAQIAAIIANLKSGEPAIPGNTTSTTPSNGSDNLKQ